MTDFVIHRRGTGERLADINGTTWRDENGALRVRFPERRVVDLGVDVFSIEVRHPDFAKPRFLTDGFGDTDGKGNAFFEFLLTDDLNEARAGWAWTD